MFGDQFRIQRTKYAEYSRPVQREDRTYADALTWAFEDGSPTLVERREIGTDWRAIIRFVPTARGTVEVVVLDPSPAVAELVPTGALKEDA